jgi:hypothetical protein
MNKEQNMRASIHPHAPWYREPWPWLLMAGPLAVVVASLFTAWLAVVHEDGLVADDYYKQGLAINREIRRESTAATLGLHASIMFGDNRVRVLLRGASPRELRLQLVHPTRSGLDRTTRLAGSGNGWYEGSIDTGGARWHVVLEDAAGVWRMGGEWLAREGGTLDIDARAAREAGR